jgi:hypothetical protein
MAAFKLWARVEKIGPRSFGAVVAAVPDRPGSSPHAHDIRRKIFATRDVAETALMKMALSLRDLLLARGDRVTASF